MAARAKSEFSRNEKSELDFNALEDTFYVGNMMGVRRIYKQT